AAGRAHGRTRPCWFRPACRPRGFAAASFIVLSDRSLYFRTDSTQQIDLLRAEAGAGEQPAQPRHQLLRMGRIEEVDADERALEMVEHRLDLGAGGRLALGRPGRTPRGA